MFVPQRRLRVPAPPRLPVSPRPSPCLPTAHSDTGAVPRWPPGFSLGTREALRTGPPPSFPPSSRWCLLPVRTATWGPAVAHHCGASAWPRGSRLLTASGPARLCDGTYCVRPWPPPRCSPSAALPLLQTPPRCLCDQLVPPSVTSRGPSVLSHAAAHVCTFS